jgi:hypothetical protein
MNRFLPLWPHRFPHFGYIYLGGFFRMHLLTGVEHFGNVINSGIIKLG